MTDAARSALVRRLNARSRRRALLILGVPLLLLGAGLCLIHVRNGELVAASCGVTASEELGFLTVRLEVEVGGERHRSPALASCRAPAERARGCGQPIGARVACHYFRVEPAMLLGERPRLPLVPAVPGAFLALGVLALLWALGLALRAPPEIGSTRAPAWTPLMVSARSAIGMILGSLLLLAGLFLSGMAVHLLWTSASLYPGLGYFALVAGLCAALLGSLIGFSRSQLHLDEELRLLERRRGLFSPFWRRCYALEELSRARVEEVKGRTAKGGAYRHHYVVLDAPEVDGDALWLPFPDAESARSAASRIEPLLAGR